MLDGTRIAIVGIGNIGRILLARMQAADVPAGNLIVCDADPDRAAAARNKYGVRIASLADPALCEVDLLLLASPPNAVPEIVAALAPRLRAGQVVVSMAAAVPLKLLESLVPAGVVVVRVLPNAPSLVGQGMNPVCYPETVTPQAQALVEAVLATLGSTVGVRDEQMNWCVGLSGAAMRSLLPALEGMAQAGIEAGLTPEASRRVAAQVMLGTAALVLETGLSLEQIKMLTPMQTVDEPVVAAQFLEAARAAQAKIDSNQRKLMEAWGGDGVG
jgi:pyrroline-5-carboxylate reductase